MPKHKMIEMLLNAKVTHVDTMSDGYGFTVRFDNGVNLTLWDAGETEWDVLLKPKN